MSELSNIIWVGQDNKAHLNIYSRVLEHLKRAKIDEQLFKKVEDIYTDISYAYFANRPNMSYSYKLNLDRELGLLHDGFSIGMYPIESDDFAFRYDECELLSQLIEERLDSEQLKTLSKIAFDYWAEAGKLGDPEKLRFKAEKEEGIPHINTANDYMGKQIYQTLKDKINAGETIRIYDLGAGTGGTTEAVIHWVNTLAKENGISAAIEIDAVEFNDTLAEGLEIKRQKLEKEYIRTEINIFKSDMEAHAREQAKQTSEKYDAILASYSMHHLLNKDKEYLLRDSHKLLKRGGIFLWADPNEGKSWINRHFFNFTDEGTFASFISHTRAKEMLENAGYSESNVATDAEYISTICWQFMSQKELGILYDNCQNHNGYVCIGRKL